MIYPSFLKPGMKIGVPAPSDAAYDEPHKNRYENALKKFKNLGFEVELSKNILHSEKSRSADAKTRGEEINEMFSREDIDYILCAAGGEFLVECLPFVDFEKLVKNPKFVQGFSDPTGLLFPITTKYDIATLYGMNFGEYGMENWYKKPRRQSENHARRTCRTRKFREIRFSSRRIYNRPRKLSSRHGKCLENS